MATLQRLAISTEFSRASGTSLKSSHISSSVFRYCSGLKRFGLLGSAMT